MANIVCFIQARRTSTRLPGKVDLPLGDCTVLQRVERAANRTRSVDSTYIVVPEDYPDVGEDDVLGRFIRHWGLYWDSNVQGIVRLTGDCPLMDPQVIDLVVNMFLKKNVEYCSNVYPKRTFPDGLDVEVFTPELLERAAHRAWTHEDREHVTPWMQKHARTFFNVTLPIDWSHVRLTLDTMEDYQWLQTAINAPRTG